MSIQERIEVIKNKRTTIFLPKIEKRLQYLEKIEKQLESLDSLLTTIRTQCNEQKGPYYGAAEKVLILQVPQDCKIITKFNLVRI